MSEYKRRTWIIIIAGVVVIAGMATPLFKVWHFVPFQSQRDIWVGIGWGALILALVVITALIAMWSENN